MKSIEVVGIGANVHDTLLEVGAYPKEDTKLRAENRISCGGGPCATGLVACSKLGAATAFIGNVSDDPSGRFLIDDFKRYGVETRYMTEKKGFDSFVSYVILSRESTSRTIVFDKGNVPPLELNDEQRAAVADAKLLMVDGNDLGAAIDGAKTARENGTKVLYDAGGLYEGVERLLPLCDIIIPSEEFALGITGKDSAEDAARAIFERYSPDVVVVTCGKRGGVMCDGNGVRSYAAYKVDAVDSNGAGDVFHGAFAYAMTRGFDFMKACKFSSAVSALKCTKVGARAGVPDFASVIKFLKEHGENEFEENME